MALKSGLFITLFLFTLQASGIKDVSRDHLSGNRNVKYKNFYEASQATRHLSAVQDSLVLYRLRVKRSPLFSTGVRACPQENMAEVIARHKSYYKLRVCQDVVWEAFQIFLDRVPDMTEFQQWVHACQTDSLCVEDLAHNFSSSQEHLDIVARRLSIQNDQEQQMRSPESIAVHYAMVFETEVDSTRIGTKGTESNTEIALKDMILKALREDPALPLYIRSLSFETTKQNHLKDLPVDNARHLPRVISTQATLANSEDTTESINISEEEAAPNGTQGRDEEGIESTFPTQETTYKNTSLDSLSKVSEVEQALGNEIAAMPTKLNLNSMKDVRASTSNQYSESEVGVSDALFKEEISSMPYFTPTEMPKAEGTAGNDTVTMDGISETPEASSFTESSEVPSTNQPIELIRLSLIPRTEGTIQHMHSASIPKTLSSVDISHASLPSELPGNLLNKKEQPIQTFSSHQAKVCDKEAFIKGLPSETDISQSSAPSLDKDVGVFFTLQITNMIFSEDLLNSSSPGYKSLEDTFLELLLQFLQSDLIGFKELHILNFRNGSVVVNKKMKLSKPVVDNLTKPVHCILDNLMTSNAASKKKDRETDSHSADHVDPCKYMNCNEFSHCVVNMLNKEAECLCDPGYSTVDGLHCQSICNLQPNYCLNGGLCENIPGHGASCRCPSGKYWYYDGEHCSELVSVPIGPVIFVLCLMGSLTVVCAVIGLHSHSHLSMEGIMRVNPVFENDDGILTHVSSISYPTITDSGSAEPSDQGSFYSLENMQLSIETWSLYNEHRGSDSDGFEVTVL
ncbi:hypothetical protein Q7C36_011523 [Tachysurus vachellii]|uniref:Interphotoreceptor matrix proteoglycan 1 n=1 Tax=Tachysurus vachellii TaxID=175792 RepID=A0AA88MUB0_TACVA|nr:hypothetical protein Q7C36_011523 [Tachysurus vachellii]